MNSDDPFPLHSMPSRVRTAILHEFLGRCPSVQEVTRITDKQWLTVPGIGCAALEIIRSVTHDQLAGAKRSSSAKITDAELLKRLEFLQQELRILRNMLNLKHFAEPTGSDFPEPAIAHEFLPNRDSQPSDRFY
jgi:hypothetical protein